MTDANHYVNQVLISFSKERFYKAASLLTVANHSVNQVSISFSKEQFYKATGLLNCLLQLPKNI